ncbi:hypothetical protein [Crenothrix sp.]|uniref:hypothetical protein n=1 Tax=Crenothrix sp. TaxID=3100433 RepID=UPI00374C9DC6
MLTFLKKYHVWLGAEGYCILGLIVICLIVILLTPHFCHDTIEQLLRYGGLILQLIGIGITVRGLWDVRREFGKLSLPKMINAWWSRAPWKSTINEPTPVILSIRVAINTFYSPPSTDTIEDRLKGLEANMEMIYQINKNEIDSLNAQSNCHNIKHSQTNTRLENFALDGIPMALVAIIYVVLGSIFSTVPQEIATWLS